METKQDQPIAQLNGWTLRRDIFNDNGLVVLSEGTILNESHVKRLQMLGITLTALDVYNASAKGEEAGSSPNSIQKINAHELVDDAIAQVRTIFDQIRQSSKLPLSDIRKEILPCVQDLSEEHDLYHVLSSLQSKDDYTYRHNIGVGVLSTLIGKWMNLPSNEIAQLTVAATLHDVGKMKIPNEILMKPEKLTAEEYALMKKHTIFGYEMLKSTVGTNHREALVALQHHEREDGTGYPFGLRSHKIDLFSRIVAVADVFHAMSSTRSYRMASPFYEILKEMHEQRFGAFDPKVIGIFLGKMMGSLVGNTVELTDDRVGIIVMINAHDPIHPLVQIDDAFLDLSKQSSVHIRRVLAN
ncbi:HD-GYP domain-containing protein [Paenibacillus turpanensis]|uniref:HD-GYP domain-containing protein n=1 Tax=Paenibacillus turpanensis TaxID=2689078 RepID=UPI0014091CF4|nr:HD-GYP domain-containing protein [Paenibacillus turpanensis]